MKNYSLNLEILEGTYCVCKGLSTHDISNIQEMSDFFSLTKTCDELSVVCSQMAVPNNVQAECERDWKIFKVMGPLDFSLVGILANLSALLTAASISIFVISTFDTDYILIKEVNLDQAVTALEKGGHTIKTY